MESKDMLSQEEIDALLRQGDIGEGDVFGESGEEVKNYLTPLEVDALGEIGNITFGNASTALSTLLGQKVDITTPEVSLLKKEELSTIFPHPHVSVQVEYTQGFTGTNILVLKTGDAAVIADLMMGGTGETPATELGEMELSACQEAMNQMMGAAATSMSSLFQRLVNISPPKVDILDIPAGKVNVPVFEEDPLIRIAFNLRIGSLIQSSIMQLLPLSFAKELAKSLLGGGASPNEEKKEERIAERKDVSSREEEKRARSEPASLSHSSPPVQESRNQRMKNPEPQVQAVQFANFEKNPTLTPQNEINLNLLMDIPLQVTVELGRTKRYIKDILELGPGSILELDKLAGEPVDILVNHKLVAKGEVVVIDENFGVRITEIISQWERLQKL
ncbi:MAG: flagellar motor switch phosphatase FliY [Thermicanus sp.]|nr:flagellar motor switch phosphatase FliY [Thermicanus sp.]